MSAHTPGPWISENYYDRQDRGVSVIASADPFKISNPSRGQVAFVSSRAVGKDEAFCNARLIAAAPDLLHALEMVRDANRDDPHIPQPALDCINAAIAKATGTA